MEPKGGEVRRLHIIYFLSRMGHIEHPHLIRVHHLSPSGVYLRDVKRWLGELRGKDMPGAFSWSYKRRYKAGYVWQDLMDDDLITPISDNEYVLKGSQINPTEFETQSLGERKASILDDKKLPQVEAENGKQQKQQASLKEESQLQIDSYLNTDTPTKFSSEISQESLVFSSDRSTLADANNSFLIDEVMLRGAIKESPNEQSNEKVENCSLPSLYHLMLNNSKKQDNKEKTKECATPNSSFSTSTSSSSQSSSTKSKSYSPKAYGVLRNLVTCGGGGDTNDAVLITLNKSSKTGLQKSDSKTENEAGICRVDSLGHSFRSFGTSWNYQHQQQHGARKSFDEVKETNRNKKGLGGFMNQTRRPFGGPTCSQCGKSFKPEKMHKHMKSCRGMKSKSKSAANSAEKTELQKSRASFHTDSTCDHLLTN